MNSPERIFVALNHEEPDHVPLDLWMSAGFQARLQSELGLTAEGFRDARYVDMRHIEGPRYVGPPLPDGRRLRLSERSPGVVGHVA